ncbi:lytic transglycosylase domain-containing protein [Primorskyibacter sp. 2E107]|uniref:lytic transglycosylase domain-containing protein n=1 Tax=Primorskyibacter sp. 2E107 TaxID=3403458 RepID=UPI003AF45523
MVFRVFLVVLAILSGAAGTAREPGTMCSPGAFGQVQCIRPAHFVFDTCQAIESFAKEQSLDPGFFARLIWQESRFNPNALSHANAQGIAQFIPSTAGMRGLRDPYNPAEALEYSAEYLGELRRRYGNHGLAAVAYNGGERRADGLVAGTGGLARETIDYVRIITGLTAWDWANAPPQSHDFSLQKDKPFAQACHELARKRILTAFPPPKPSVKPFGVQLAFGTTKQKALTLFQRKTAACGSLLKGEEPVLIWEKSRASPQGGYYMARIGRNTRDAAWTLCGELKKRGCVCAVYKND